GPEWCAVGTVRGVPCGFTVDRDAGSEIAGVGTGAGGEATGAAVVSDIADIARGVRAAAFGRPSVGLASVEKAPMQRHEGGYYIRMLAVDKPGTAARIATCFAEESISLESIMQRHFGPRPLGGEDPSAARPVPVILITYATTEDAVRRALAKVEAEQVTEGKPQLIRIEKTWKVPKPEHLPLGNPGARK